MSTLGNRMKTYESVWHTSVSPNSYVVLRLDGRAFHTVLRNATKPYDVDVARALSTAAEKLCEQVPGAEFAYLQSDEISILMTDLRTVRSELWFGGDVQKLVSVGASVATQAFNDVIRPAPGYQALAGITQPGYFDARVLTLPHPIEVANYFVWRQRDAQRNAVTSAARAYFGQRDLNRKNVGEVRAMLRDVHGVDFPRDYPNEFVDGRVLHKQTRVSFELMAERIYWTVDAAPEFIARGGNWLAENIPAQPDWKDDEGNDQ